MNSIHQRLKLINDTVNFYHSFNRYKENTREELFDYLSTPFSLKQYKYFYKENRMSGFISWAYLDELNEEHYMKTGKVNNWKSGNIVWLVDVLSMNDVKSIVEWGKKYFTDKIGKNKKVNYLRMDKDLNIKKISYLLTKEFY
jgi:hemolysin-activating ACP:hemolysin acyltransferase